MVQLNKGRKIQSPVSGTVYIVKDMIGLGGFGSVYKVVDQAQPNHDMCLKITEDSPSWHREAYFGELLRESDRAVKLYEAFPYIYSKSTAQVGYCLVSELAEHGAVLDFITNNGTIWNEAKAKKEITELLKLLDGMHRTGAIHRDLTPMNVFVCDNHRLKLGDFGIARHVLAGNNARASAFNPWWAPKAIGNYRRKHWHPSDDIYQIGQLFHVLLSGDASGPVTRKQVAKLTCSEKTKQIISKAIRTDGQGYVAAGEFLEELTCKKEPFIPLPDDPRGFTVVFTGKLDSMNRPTAQVIVRQKGALVANRITESTRILVQGGRSALYLTTLKGTKLLEAEKLIKKGHEISIISEPEFLNLFG